MIDYVKQLPTLQKPVHWGAVTSQFSGNTVFDEKLVSNVSIVATVGDRYVIMQLDNGNWEMAGGTVEPGEAYLECVVREAMEELGAQIIDFTVFGHFYCVSSASKPYRPHIPHPNFIRVVGTGKVRLVSKPLNPPDGERVVSVELVHIDTAVRRFAEIGRNDIAELYKLAHYMRTVGFIVRGDSRHDLGRSDGNGSNYDLG